MCGKRKGKALYSVLVLASDLGVDACPLLSPVEREGDEVWHECLDKDLSDLGVIQTFCVEGSDKSGNCVLCIVGKSFPAAVISRERLKKSSISAVVRHSRSLLLEQRIFIAVMNWGLHGRCLMKCLRGT
ncbi:hypothetical protein J5N97_024136 [Dioscorea zingiberensis]|uniref:Uncharacterized protein n=1 Tax=Dioscorea zingiberensis TaxID=325984 RepID=A0A9D5H8H1_9LILI|nr:hypothetical protein J5N97_024136 [Dioscorea zingiberensis]